MVTKFTTSKNSRKQKTKKVAINTEVAIYLFEATGGDYDPAKDTNLALAKERLAMFRIFLYTSKIRYTPEVLNQIKIEDQLSFVLANLPPIGKQSIKIMKVNKLENSYVKFHKDHSDCRILAEAIVSGCDCLLTFDKDIVKHLKNKVRIVIMNPSEWWEINAPPKKIKPILKPHWTNPKVTQDWYKW
jgi:predicted nucleic acid-binding protein